MEKVVLTGASGDIGRAIFSYLHSKNYSVALWVRKEDANFLDFIKQVTKNQLSNHCLIYADLESRTDIEQGIRETKSWCKNPNILINSAGYPYGSHSLMTPQSELIKTYQINLFAPLQLIQSFSRGMIKSKKGNIINIASIQGVIAEKGNLAYGGSKSALIHSTKILAQEIGTEGIKINCISPSAVDSKMARLMDEKSLERLNRYSARGSEILIDEVIGTMKYLLSSDSDGHNGFNFRLDGGMPF